LTKEEALKLALEALEGALSDDKPYIAKCKVALNAIKEALAQPQETDWRAAYQEAVRQHSLTLDELREALAQPAPPPPECKTEAEKIAYSFGWWKALEYVKAKQPAQEPVGYIDHADGLPVWAKKPARGSLLYTTPPQRKPLTDKQILADETLRYNFGRNNGAGPVSKQGRKVIDAIEALHGIKENT